ncbi:MAG TPA: ATP-grasp fold amidoligase family protein [Candidatus Paceibacterota bacterium]|nr:ATP-grasp fold amidoligase family protein [Candidatus Paceibacterota bacterium]
MTWLVSVYFWYVHGYWPWLRRPRSFEEKVNARMLFDRDPRWTTMSDKLRVRTWVAGKCGSDILIPLLWSGAKPDDIPFDVLPRQCVLKTNHGCGYTIIVNDIAQLDRSRARRQLERWLGENFCHDYVVGAAWAYRNIQPVVMVESFIGDGQNAPLDYKFFVFDGKVEVFKVDFDRFRDHSVLFFDRDCRACQVHEKGLRRYSGSVDLPENIGEMIDVAETLANGIDFIRVDLFSVRGRVYFGEMTCYPSGGAGPWLPESFDFMLGSKWRLAPFTAACSGVKALSM